MLSFDAFFEIKVGVCEKVTSPFGFDDSDCDFLLFIIVNLTEECKFLFLSCILEQCCAKSTAFVFL